MKKADEKLTQAGTKEEFCMSEKGESASCITETEDAIEDDMDMNTDNSEKFEEECKAGRFRRYSKPIGRGSYKIVYKALDQETGKEVAWNIINVERLAKDDKKRVYDEITLLKKLRHPNIVQALATWYDAGKKEVVFITELVVATLKAYLVRINISRPKLRAIKGWCKGILQGLKYLHENDPPIIHRDIKCDNIFINTNNGEVKIGDLGLATTLREKYAHSLVGTPEYMAPELYEEKYSTKVDVYAFGMCLLEMMTLETPYKECANVGLIYKKVYSKVLPEALMRVELEDVKNIIAWCLETEDKRPTIQQLLEHPFFSDQSNPSNNAEVTIKTGKSKVRNNTAYGNIPCPVTFEDPGKLMTLKSSIELPKENVKFASAGESRKGSLNLDSTEVSAKSDTCYKVPKNPMKKNSGTTIPRMKDNKSARKSVTTPQIELTRAVDDEAKSTVKLAMIIEDKYKVPLQITFSYCPLTDTPYGVAKEMVKELALDESEIVRLKDNIKAELKSLVAHFNIDPEQYLWSKRTSGVVKEIAKLKESYDEAESKAMESSKSLEELDNLFALEAANLCKRYQDMRRKLL